MLRVTLTLLGLVLLASASPGFGDVLEELVHTATGICEGNSIVERGGASSCPVDILNDTTNQIVFTGSLEDLMREKIAGKKTTRIARTRSSLGLIFPFQANGMKSALALSVARNTFASEWDSYPDRFHTSLDLRGYSSVLSYATSFHSNRLGISLKLSSLENHDGLDVSSYPRSDDEAYNKHFYDLLPRTFGSFISYASSNRMRSAVLEDVYQINGTYRLGAKLRLSRIISDVSATYLNSTTEEDFPGGEDFGGTKTADNETVIKGRAFEASCARNLNEILDVALTFGVGSQQATWNTDPRNPKQKGEIYIETKHWSDGILDALALGVRGDLSCRLSPTSRLCGSLAFAEQDLSGHAFGSTPVLGKEFYVLPIVHRANAKLSGSASSQLYEARFERRGRSGLTLDAKLGILHTTLRMHVKATGDFYGIESPPLDQEIAYRGFKLWIADLRMGYPLNEHLSTSYNFKQYVPSAPTREVDGKPVRPGPPGPEKETRGGGIHTISVAYSF